jgi:predicted transcriptional regulator
MTQDELISMAKDAGCPDVYTEWAKSDWASIKGLILPMTLEQLKHCAKMVAAKEREACADAALKAAESSIVLAMKIEREACAKLCEDGLNIATCLNALDDMEMWGEKFAKAIRARGQA